MMANFHRIIIQFNVTVDGTCDWPYSDRERILGGNNIKNLIKSYCKFFEDIRNIEKKIKKVKYNIQYKLKRRIHAHIHKQGIILDGSNLENFNHKANYYEFIWE